MYNSKKGVRFVRKSLTIDVPKEAENNKKTLPLVISSIKNEINLDESAKLKNSKREVQTALKGNRENDLGMYMKKQRKKKLMKEEINSLPCEISVLHPI